jgi:hypothetical protein
MRQSLNSTLRRLYQVVMDPEVTSLRYLPVQQRMQVMVALGTMWTLIFTASTGAWLYFGYLLAAHVLIPVGALVTGITFRFAERRGHARRKA